MVPINKRLNDQEKVEYLRKVFDLRKRWSPYENAIHEFCEVIKDECDFVDENDMDSIYLKEFKDVPYLCRWLLLSFNDLKHIKSIIDADKYHGEYLKFLAKVRGFKSIYREFWKKDINNWIIETSGVKVCPYCNLAYTFNRGSKTMGQLDHFFPESKCPEFAICYYNLIPSCPTCNRIKSAETGMMVSPYDDDAYSTMRIFATASKRINYMDLKDAEANIKIEVLSDRAEEMENVDQMHLNDAYGQVKDYAAEILRKKIIYKNECSRELIINAVKRAGISDDEILRFYFGNYIDEEEKGKRIMDKMVSDLFHQDEIG